MNNASQVWAAECTLSQFIRRVHDSPLAPWAAAAPWQVTSQAAEVVRRILGDLPAHEYGVEGEVAIHRGARVETGAILKGPLILGADCFVAAGAYLRGGCWLGEGCSLGAGVELKSSFLFPRSRLAHFNFVGDAWVGEDVNFEAGSIVCNHRNEREDKDVRVRLRSGLHRTGVEKFGAVVGDGSRIGANAVLAPGALLFPGSVVQRLQLLDQELITYSAPRASSP